MGKMFKPFSTKLFSLFIQAPFMIGLGIGEIVLDGRK
jgi:hypothetical protein